MTKKERMRAVFKREPVDRIPAGDICVSGGFAKNAVGNGYGKGMYDFARDQAVRDYFDMDFNHLDMQIGPDPWAEICPEKPRDFEKMVESVVMECNPWNGYTTCMWHNLITSNIVLDKRGNLTKMQEKYRIPYPKKLKENIISNNLKLLSGMLPSFDGQIKKAEKRGDLVSVNHRVTEFLAGYFDIIFALNEMTHPGEKRMQSICSKECAILPDNFDENLNRLFDGMFREEIYPVICDMVEEIKKVAKND